jgi:hypothetical protein
MNRNRRAPIAKTGIPDNGKKTRISTRWRPVDMKPFKIKKQNGNMEVVAKITDSMVQEYGCRVKYNKESGQVDLIGEDYCKDIVTEVVTDMIDD